jgi:hypothetical protein
VAAAANRGVKEKVLSQLDKAISQMKGEKFEEQFKSFFGSKKRELARIMKQSIE